MAKHIRQVKGCGHQCPRKLRPAQLATRRPEAPRPGRAARCASELVPDHLVAAGPRSTSNEGEGGAWLATSHYKLSPEASAVGKQALGASAKQAGAL